MNDAATCLRYDMRQKQRDEKQLCQIRHNDFQNVYLNQNQKTIDYVKRDCE